MANSLSVGVRVMYRRLGETGFRESTVRRIFPEGKLIELETGEIGYASGVTKLDAPLEIVRSDA